MKKKVLLIYEHDKDNRVCILGTKKIKYNEVKLRQKQDLNSGVSEYYIYRHISTPFTWLFVKFGISPNIITISSLFLCLLGFYFFSLGTYAYIMVGLLFFLFFKIMDMSDGEVARIQNKKSIEGLYFDRVSHYVFSCCFGLGLGFGLYRLYQSDIYIILGFLFTFAFVMENAMLDLLKSTLRKNIINKKIKTLDEHIYQKLMHNVNEGHSWLDCNIFSKLAGIYPFQGIIYTDTFITPILMCLTLIEYSLIVFSGASTIYRPFRIIALYLLIVSISKIIWIIGFIYKMEKNRYITSTLNKLK